MSKALIVARKEIADFVTSKKLWLILGLFVLLAVASTYSVTFIGRIGGQFITRQTSRQMFLSLTSTMTYMAPILGIALAFDAISGEREKGTLKLLLSRPIYRDDVINGKIISAIVIIGLTITATSLVSAAASILVHGIPITSDDLLRIFIFVLLSIAFSFAYYAISLFISTIFNKSGHSLAASIGIWIIFTFILPIISSLIASIVVGPPPSLPSNATERARSQIFIDYMRKVSRISGAIQIFSINYHFSQTANSLFGTIIGPAEFGQGRAISLSTALSSRLVDLAIIVIYPIIFLIAAYIFFTRSEER